MDIQNTPISGLFVFQPELHRDERGFLYESFSQNKFEAGIGRAVSFVQDNHTLSHQHVLRGLHFQTGAPQAKLVRVTSGVIFDVCVDLRQSSPTFKHWVGVEMSAENRKQIFIPEGCAHGFLTLSAHSEISYKLSDFYAPAQQTCLKWDDPTIGVEWPLAAPPILSAKDAEGQAFAALSLFP